MLYFFPRNYMTASSLINPVGFVFRSLEQHLAYTNICWMTDYMNEWNESDFIGLHLGEGPRVPWDSWGVNDQTYETNANKYGKAHKL